MGLPFLSLLANYLLFTAVPPSANPNSKQNDAFLHELQESLNATVVKADTGRIWFETSESDAPPRSTWPRYFQSGVRSIRMVALAYDNVQANDDEQSLVRQLNELDIAQKVWAPFGNSRLPFEE